MLDDQEPHRNAVARDPEALKDSAGPLLHLQNDEAALLLALLSEDVQRLQLPREVALRHLRNLHLLEEGVLHLDPLSESSFRHLHHQNERARQQQPSHHPSEKDVLLLAPQSESSVHHPRNEDALQPEKDVPHLDLLLEDVPHHPPEVHHQESPWRRKTERAPVSQLNIVVGIEALLRKRVQMRRNVVRMIRIQMRRWIQKRRNVVESAQRRRRRSRSIRRRRSRRSTVDVVLRRALDLDLAAIKD